MNKLQFYHFTTFPAYTKKRLPFLERSQRPHIPFLKVPKCNSLGFDLRANADHTAANASASIAGGRAQLVAAHAQIVDIGVHDQRAAHDVVRTAQLNLVVGQLHLANAIGARFDVAQIADMTRRRLRSAVRLALRIEVRSGRHATVGVVAELVHMEAVQTGLQAGDLAADGHWAAGGLRW